MKKIIAAFLFTLVMYSGTAFAADNFILLSDTASPDEKYSLAWGYASASVDFAKLNKGDEEYFNTIPEEDAVENYIVASATGKIVGKLENSDYFKIGEMSKNHADMLIAWSEDAKLLLYGLSSKWQTDTIDIYKVTEDGTFTRYELMAALDKEIRNYLKKKHAKGYRKNDQSIVISYSGATLTSAGKMSLTANVEVPKQETFGFTLTINAQTDLAQKPVVKLLSVDIKEENQ